MNKDEVSSACKKVVLKVGESNFVECLFPAEGNMTVVPFCWYFISIDKLCRQVDFFRFVVQCLV